MKENRYIKITLLILSLVVGALVIMYYWSVVDVDGILMLPMYVVILSFVYVLLQILKRYLFKRKNWWDWLYYIGLIAIVLPTFFVNETNAATYHLLTDYGTFFLIIPILLDGAQLVKNKE
jgi:uncharacterized membrane protein HdeD (DUF308 family)